jgi:ATP-dependent helicase HrpB
MDDADEARRASALLAAEVRSRGAAAVADPEALRELRARVELVALHAPEARLRPLTSADEGEALAALCEGRSSLDELRGLDLAGLLLERAGPSAAAALARLAPEQVALPGGRRVRIEYAEGQPPAARSRLQDFFGMARGPSVVAGRVPVVLHLLAPNGRAQQVTQDLAGFWSRHYPAVRKELMRKYPRHAWPEDGARATPPAPRR